MQLSFPAVIPTYLFPLVWEELGFCQAGMGEKGDGNNCFFTLQTDFS